MSTFPTGTGPVGTGPVGAEPAASGPAEPAIPGARARLGSEGLLPVSPRLIRARALGAAIPCLLLLAGGAGCIVWAAMSQWWWLLAVALVLILFVVQWLALIPRRVGALGYRDRESTFVTASGILIRSVTVVPYGRIQAVEVTEGPIERRLGLATLSLSTAAVAADTTVPGLEREEAERLRSLLTARGVDRMQSL